MNDVPFGWLKQSEIDAMENFGGSLNLWKKKYPGCDVAVFLHPPESKLTTINERVEKCKADPSLATYWRNQVANIIEDFTATRDQAMYASDKILETMYGLPREITNRPKDVAPTLPEELEDLFMEAIEWGRKFDGTLEQLGAEGGVTSAMVARLYATRALKGK